MATVFTSNAMDGIGKMSHVQMAREGQGRMSAMPVPMTTMADDLSQVNMTCSSSHTESPQQLHIPPPNPPFVFPATPISPAMTTSYSRKNSQRPRSAVDIPNVKTLGLGLENLPPMPSMSNRRAKAAALPNFTFNPGATLGPSPTSSDRSAKSSSLALPELSSSSETGLGIHDSSSSSSSTIMSPPLSPPTPKALPARGVHRRGGSEFVGGKIRRGESITVMSTSPTKSESGFASAASPLLAPADVPQRRGRHAHRRSAAISHHDLTMILKPSTPNPARGDSAPSSPAGNENEAKSECKSSLNSNLDSTLNSASLSPPAELASGDELDLNESPDKSPSPESPLDLDARPQPDEDADDEEPIPIRATSAKPVSRTRVGFSDTLEYIPRPLSMVSTDTSSTATARPGHSVSGSISSLISLTIPTPIERDAPCLPAPQVSCKQSESRPSTAGAVLERTPSVYTPPVEDATLSPRRRNSIPLLFTSAPTGAQTDSPATPSPTKVAFKRWSFFGFESLTSANFPLPTRPQSSSSSETAAKCSNPATSSSEDVIQDSVAETQIASTLTKVPSKKKKQKKVKSWAGSILTRKSKQRCQKSKSVRRRSLTPPVPKLDLDEFYDETTSDGAESLSESPSLSAPPTCQISPNPDVKTPTSADDDAPFPMIDLDAALGPFNTPGSRDPAWDEAQKAGAPLKRQLHSAAGLRGFSGPGMHYHRRAESAPEMPPFEAARFGIHRFGSSSTMADVFEEDEEDEGGDKIPAEQTQSETSGNADMVTSSVDDSAVTSPVSEPEMGTRESRESFSSCGPALRKNSGSSLELQSQGPRMRTETSVSSLHEDVISEEKQGPKAVDQERIYEALSESTDAAASSPRRIVHSTLVPVDVHTGSLPTPSLMSHSPYSMSHTSSFPSPRSPMSCDANQVSTAPSSVAEENNFQSLLMGEPGPEVVRISIDIPSLTSSNTTTTRESNFPGVRPRNAPFHDQRPASVTSAVFGRRRSSLASLSRLINSAHGERSKLSIEVPIELEAGKKPKVSKTKRLSRLVQFWKSKDPEEA